VRGPPCLLIPCAKVDKQRPARPPGMQRRCRRFPIPWPSCSNTLWPADMIGVPPNHSDGVHIPRVLDRLTDSLAFAP